MRLKKLNSVFSYCAHQIRRLTMSSSRNKMHHSGIQRREHDDDDDGLTPAKLSQANGSDKLEAAAAANGTFIKLDSGQIYKFDCKAVGSFRIRGGSTTGNLTISGSKVTIKNDQGMTVFDFGDSMDNVHISDNVEDNTTTVTVVPGAFRRGSRGLSVISKIVEDFRNINSCRIDGNGISFSSSSGSSYIMSLNGSHHQSVEGNSALNIVACLNESIKIRGQAGVNYVINGNGGFIKMSRAGNVDINGFPQSIDQTGFGSVHVNNGVNGPIQQSGCGNTYVHGDVDGAVSLTGSGDIVIHGDVDGAVSLTGTGDIVIHGDVNGAVSLTGSGDIVIHRDVKSHVCLAGSGDIMIRGDVWSSINLVGSGDISVCGVHRRGGISNVGSGTLRANNRYY